MLPVVQDIDHANLDTPEEIHVCKLLHLFHVTRLCDLFVVEEDPRRSLFTWQLLAHKRNVVTVTN
jgi:hypothetical protein